MEMPATTLVWFRQDLRLADNPALSAAVARGRVVPVFVWSPDEEGDWQPGSPSRWWLERSLERLAEDLLARGARLIVRTGDSQTVLRGLLAETGADAVFWNRRYEPAARFRDARVRACLEADGIRTRESNSATLFEPHELRDEDGKPFLSFDAFWREGLARTPADPIPAPDRIDAPERLPLSLPLRGRIDGSESFRDFEPVGWEPGERGAWKALDTCLAPPVESLDRAASCELCGWRLGAHLHFGEISPNALRREVLRRAAARPGFEEGAEAERLLRGLGWREFALHHLYRNPLESDPYGETPEVRDSAAERDYERRFDLWRLGRTGFPLVDAAMRELRRTAWMHPRLRLLCATFAIRRLGIRWGDGARWFSERLLDADVAEIVLTWRRLAGEAASVTCDVAHFTPADARRYDPRGVYVRLWVPELAGLPARYIHRPFEAPAAVLAEAGVRPGIEYPHPVPSGEARVRSVA